ncbi:MAG: Fe-S protein assembly co-chaperone HscB [Tepidimonas sp.]|uniref:Fe-S protein assembly co-chaperone HscB n=1 Tax=Tepidimonas sp. TaxID=2002775 RepID=UPI00259EFAE2|nr:Fe-S protein assembly co-chaperone HscB [Tepidimonas sp.]MDM7456501.1 Fe-S protein assembly co-chaperone HscB [Tepidimonas sp.]
MSEDGPSLQDDDFALFGLPRRFQLDRSELDARWKQLQRMAHPDRFAHQGTAAQRIAMQWSVRINEAYQRLRDPLRRAAYWCELQGAPIEAESNTAMPANFLQQQMQWREALDDAHTPQDIEALLQAVEAERRERLDALAEAIDVHADAQAAVVQVRALMFIERFADTLQARLDG